MKPTRDRYSNGSFEETNHVGIPSQHARTRVGQTDGTEVDATARTGGAGRYHLAPPVWRGPGAFGRYWDLLRSLVSRAIKQRYKRSVLGFAWTMLNPLITMIILTVVFSAVFGNGVARYPLFVIIGLLAWNLFALGSSQGLASIVDSGPLIRKVAVPKAIFPLAAVGANLVNFLLALVPLLVILMVMGFTVTWSVLWVPVGILLVTAFTLGVAMLLATMNVFFRDVRYFYEAGLLAWFYATPVFYPIEIVSPSARAVLTWNPMYVLVEIFRTPLYAGHGPEWGVLGRAMAEAAIALLVGWRVFRRYEGHFADYV